tara:strand:+ start:174292 stop:175689 length:1398 start_codon:yes stop_codon:yes gene_type:complete
MSLVNLEMIKNIRSLKKIKNEDSFSFTNVCSDNRKYVEEDVFLFLEGDNFDAYSFIDNVIKLSGVKTLIIRWSKERENLFKGNHCVLWVTDSLQFIQDLGTLNAKKFRESGKEIVGITGSNGKTTNKEYVSKLLKLKYSEEEILFTKGNLNNHIGVPLTLLRLSHQHKVAIIEMGTSSFGEIKNLCNMAQPTYGLITCIGEAHLEKLKDLDGVLSEKRALYDYINSHNESKKIILNLDDKYLAKLDVTEKVTNFSVDKNKSDNLLKIEENGICLATKLGKISCSNKTIIGNHNWVNLAQCVLLVLEIYPDIYSSLEKNIDSISFDINLNRGSFINWHSAQVYLDAYNANPASMKASILAYIEQTKSITFDDKLFIVGDMNELGESSDGYHVEIGKFLKKIGAKHCWFIGRFSNKYVEGFGHAEAYLDASQCSSKLLESIKNKQYSSVLIKGSRSLQLESILDIKN